MSKGLAFWIIYLISLLMFLWFGWPIGGMIDVVIIVAFVLAGLVGWAVFGAMIK